MRAGRFHRLVCFGAALVLPLSGQSTPGQSETQKMVADMVAQHEAWGPKASTNHASLVIQKASAEG
jgi:hypothetical protein